MGLTPWKEIYLVRVLDIVSERGDMPILITQNGRSYMEL
jgi:hypothetical protein